MNYNILKTLKTWAIIPAIALTSGICISCNTEGKEIEDELLSLSVLPLEKDTAVVNFEYLGSIEGKVNVEIRPQIEGLLDQIHVDEGDYVEKGQLLFTVNASPYMESLKNAHAAVEVEEAKLENAKIELERLKPLVDHDVISEVQLRTAQSDLEVAKASLAQSKALEATSRLNVGFTKIKAPVSGYIGRIPKRVGNLVTKNDTQPVTNLSDISEVYVYFSMSESNYLKYKRMRADSTSDYYLKPEVKLILADGSTYEHKGQIDADGGEIDPSTGTITMRASFKNPDRLVRSGNTGKVILEQVHSDVFLIPQNATYQVQNKTFVYLLQDDNTVKMKEIFPSGKSGKSFIVKGNGLSEDQTIVQSGISKISNGMKILPEHDKRLAQK